jgi:hypothetical protein
VDCHEIERREKYFGHFPACLLKIFLRGHVLKNFVFMARFKTEEMMVGNIGAASTMRGSGISFSIRRPAACIAGFFCRVKSYKKSDGTIDAVIRSMRIAVVSVWGHGIVRETSFDV